MGGMEIETFLSDLLHWIYKWNGYILPCSLKRIWWNKMTEDCKIKHAIICLCWLTIVVETNESVLLMNPTKGFKRSFPLLYSEQTEWIHQSGFWINICLTWNEAIIQEFHENEISVITGWAYQKIHILFLFFAINHI